MAGLKVLIAGRSRSHLEISRKMLRFHFDDCQVDFAHSGDECIDKTSSNTYQMVLLDHNLGDKDGLEVVGFLKVLGNQVPLIILVDEGDEEAGIAAVRQGAAEYIVKSRGYLTALPFTIKEFIQTQKIEHMTQSSTETVISQRTVNGEKNHFVVDRKGRFLSTNPNLEDVTHYSEEELLELNLVDLLPEENEKSFYEWLNTIEDNGGSSNHFQSDILGKQGLRIPLNIVLTPEVDENHKTVRYRGQLEHIKPIAWKDENSNGEIDQLEMLKRLSEVITTGYDDPLNTFLERLIEAACQIFRFQRATIALLDKRKKLFVKQAMIGYGKLSRVSKENVEVPQEVIDRIFNGRYRIKVIYYNQDHRNRASFFNSRMPERRTQARRSPNEWDKRDLVMVRLVNRMGCTFGYISLDHPFEDALPSRDTFHNLELFGQTASMAIENFYQFSTLERSSRRLKQILVTSNIFKLYLSLNELLNEVVWSVKFSLGFKLVTLGLISKRTENLEVKAVACDDKVKVSQLKQLRFPLNDFVDLFSDAKHIGKSYLVNREDSLIRSVKQVYNAPHTNGSPGGWPALGLLLVPVKSKDDKIIGVLIVDDPVDRKIPSTETVRTLEIIANQIAVAIDNRILYVQTQKRLKELETHVELENRSGLRKMFDRLF